ncbi:uncharacterized protein BT62DRAFT_922054 [Guyanagaster necrorhizus]|uniref:Uncharacterized protein n=1 Tax=Guyanagaster necrorhizus TaxID=856835 RepID=A0A9P8APY9_9AGAR|nr:uncharacterized protein BT62DRAFT_922054 [Guyanagaster necrorhizus MCA 3950]KAG7443271.1 hypothetical protein BT62DRAFT_922054 [Guyanagaster necrorhizus MCA 3950]
MVEVPQELVDVIIDHLHADRRALLACLSVSSIFRCRARFHLFPTIRLNKKRDFEEFNVLCAKSPSIPDLVKSLHVILPESVTNIPSLSRVHTLYLNGSLRVMSLHLESFSRIFSWVPSTLTSLSIEAITFPTETFRRLIGALPLLKYLSLYTVFVTGTGSVDSQLLELSRGGKGPPLEVLSIRSLNPDGVCPFFHGYPLSGPFALYNLRELYFPRFVLEQVPDIQRMLDASKDSLHELHLEPAFYKVGPVSGWSDKQFLDISQIPIVTLPLPGNRFLELEWLVACLEKGSYPLKIEQINIIITYVSFLHFWSEMDKALCGDPHFSAIRVTITCGGLTRQEALAIMSAMPGLHSEGRLSVGYKGGDGDAL